MRITCKTTSSQLPKCRPRKRAGARRAAWLARAARCGRCRRRRSVVLVCLRELEGAGAAPALQRRAGEGASGGATDAAGAWITPVAATPGQAALSVEFIAAEDAGDGRRVLRSCEARGMSLRSAQRRSPCVAPTHPLPRFESRRFPMLQPRTCPRLTPLPPPLQPATTACEQRRP